MKQFSKATILYEDPGFIRVTLEWGAEKLDLANVYALVRDSARIDFYNTLHVRGRLSSSTIVGGDWNTVTDVTSGRAARRPSEGARGLRGKYRFYPFPFSFSI